MGTFHKEDSLYSKDEANICLTCKMKKCYGKCERLKQEKQKLKAEKEPKASIPEEFILPEDLEPRLMGAIITESDTNDTEEDHDAII